MAFGTGKTPSAERPRVVSEHELAPARSRIRLPATGTWQTVYEFFCAHFPRIDAQTWSDRFGRGLIQTDARDAVKATQDFSECAGQILYYQREVLDEPLIPFEENIVFESEQILIADKPHFLPVAPVGAYVEQTLLRRLQRRYQNAELIPAHRIDQGTAGLVLLVKQNKHRAAYQGLFREHQIEKTYLAIAPFRADLQFPMRRLSRLIDGEHFMQMQEVAGIANSETEISIVTRLPDGNALYQLKPKTGKRHQLRAQMSALGIPILNDPIYPTLNPSDQGLDFNKPLKLLAQGLKFIDPVTEEKLEIESSFAMT